MFGYADAGKYSPTLCCELCVVYFGVEIFQCGTPVERVWRMCFMCERFKQQFPHPEVCLHVQLLLAVAYIFHIIKSVSLSVGKHT